MKIFLLGLLLFFSASAFAALPVLHKINTVTLTTSYSCDGSYYKSAVFLSSYSKNRNSPDLLYNGACGSPDYIEASTAGDDFSLIADLGDVDLEKVTASKAFNFDRVVGGDNIFKETARVKLNHTYAVLTSKDDIRSLIIYKVISYNPNGELILKYAVKSYSIQRSLEEASGFSWDAKSGL